MARKPFEELNFADDGMFQAVMKNTPLRVVLLMVIFTCSLTRPTGNPEASNN